VSSPGRLVLGNVLIATGTLVLSASGTLAGRLGKDRAFVVTLLVGIVILFAGFLVATSQRRRPTNDA
jgi:drug/metabolite transporter (DMT)-like permease